VFVPASVAEVAGAIGVTVVRAVVLLLLAWMSSATMFAQTAARPSSQASSVSPRPSISSPPIISPPSINAPPSTARGEWPAYGGDIGHTRYSPLDQIDASNFGDLEVAWRFKTDNLGPAPEFKLEGTPLMVRGVLYATGGTRRSVVALDAATGELRWVHGEYEGERAAVAPRRLSGRGLAYWTDGTDERKKHNNAKQNNK
jgi:glucose dehydrogenase